MDIRATIGLDMDDVRTRVHRLGELIEAKEYYEVAGGRRFRAVQRRQTWVATRAAMIVVAATALVLQLTMGLLHPNDLEFLLILNGSLAIAGLLGWWALGHRLRGRPEVIAFSVATAVLLGVVAIAVVGPRLVALAVAFTMILPLVVALVIPWRTWTEVRWLATYAAISLVFLAAVPAPWVSPSDRGDLVVVMVTSLLVSFTGHVLAFRHQVRTFVQMQAIAALHRKEASQRQELERVYQTLEVTARTDELTRVGNRMKLNEDLATARARIRRTGQQTGLLEIDLDRFKAVNDRLGHLAGDAVLRQVAASIQDAVRGDDSVYRYGGEEFVVILGSVEGGVGAAGDRCRSAVEALGLSHPGNPPFGVVTVSVGAAIFGPADLAQMTKAWFARADAALYRAKASGRNLVVVDTDPESVHRGIHPSPAGRMVG